MGNTVFNSIVKLKNSSLINKYPYLIWFKIESILSIRIE